MGEEDYSSSHMALKMMVAIKSHHHATTPQNIRGWSSTKGPKNKATGPVDNVGIKTNITNFLKVFIILNFKVNYNHLFTTTPPKTKNSFYALHSNHKLSFPFNLSAPKHPTLQQNLPNLKTNSTSKQLQQNPTKP
jgi:hypothetical protein